MKVFVIGAAGKVGARLVQRLAASGHQVMALHRKETQAPVIIADGATPVPGDLTLLSAGDLSDLMAGTDAVVFSAGAGGAGIEVTNAIDGRGLELAVAAAKASGVSRFVLVSVFPDALRDGERSEGFENYIRVKKLADAHLVASGLDFVILRPGTLSDETVTGRVRADVAIPYGNVTRDDVAATLAAILDRPALSRAIVEVTSGDELIGVAIDRIADR